MVNFTVNFGGKLDLEKEKKRKKKWVSTCTSWDSPNKGSPPSYFNVSFCVCFSVNTKATEKLFNLLKDWCGDHLDETVVLGLFLLILMIISWGVT